MENLLSKASQNSINKSKNTDFEAEQRNIEALRVAKCDFCQKTLFILALLVAAMLTFEFLGKFPPHQEVEPDIHQNTQKNHDRCRDLSPKNKYTHRGIV